MSAPDELPAALAAFAAALEREDAARVPLARCRELFFAAGAFERADEADPRRALLEALRALEAAGRLQLPSARSRHLWDAEREPRLPVHVTRPRPARAAPPRPSGPWHPLLARARDLAGPVRWPDGIDRLDAWLKAHGAGAPLAPAQERSYEIFGDEKRLFEVIATKFAEAGALTLATFHCFRVHDPFAMTRIALAADSTFAIALENSATYDSVARAAAALEAGGARPDSLPAAVIFGGGNHFVLSCEGLPDRLPHVRRLVYFGDLDAAGLAIALKVRDLLALSAVAVVPWAAAYARLLAEPPRQPESPEPLAAEPARALAAFLPEPQRAAAAAILEAGARVPQEAVGRAALERLLADGQSSG